MAAHLVPPPLLLPLGDVVFTRKCKYVSNIEPKHPSAKESGRKHAPNEIANANVEGCIGNGGGVYVYVVGDKIELLIYLRLFFHQTNRLI